MVSNLNARPKRFLFLNRSLQESNGKLGFMV